MAIKKFKPTSPGRRQMSVEDFSIITRKKPEKSLTEKLFSRAGKNNKGRTTVRHRGGGHKRKYRIVDFKRDKEGVPARVAAIEYDPNRSPHIALLNYEDGEKRYILAPLGLKPGDRVFSGKDADIKPGNSMTLRHLPVGTVIHNVELKPGKGGQLARSAGTEAQLVAKEGEYGHVRLPSGEVRLIHLNCRATVGMVGNPDHENINLGKAGRKRWLGFRPATRGAAMNPVDHPHGGGEGKAPAGRPPAMPWGKPAHGKKTRKANKESDKFIVRPRKARKR